jgi:hypothetical protein
MPAASMASRTCPVRWSTSIIASENAPLPDVPTKSGSGRVGWCTCVKGGVQEEGRVIPCMGVDGLAGTLGDPGVDQRPCLHVIGRRRLRRGTLAAHPRCRASPSSPERKPGGRTRWQPERIGMRAVISAARVGVYSDSTLKLVRRRPCEASRSIRGVGARRVMPPPRNIRGRRNRHCRAGKRRYWATGPWANLCREASAYSRGGSSPRRLRPPIVASVQARQSERQSVLP